MAAAARPSGLHHLPAHRADRVLAAKLRRHMLTPQTRIIITTVTPLTQIMGRFLIPFAA
jgi:hypothetical protein